MNINDNPIRQLQARNDFLIELNKEKDEETRLLKQEIERLRVIEQTYEAMKKAL